MLHKRSTLKNITTGEKSPRYSWPRYIFFISQSNISKVYRRYHYSPGSHQSSWLTLTHSLTYSLSSLLEHFVMLKVMQNRKNSRSAENVYILNPLETASTVCYLTKREMEEINERKKRAGFFFAGQTEPWCAESYLEYSQNAGNHQYFIIQKKVLSLTFLPDCRDYLLCVHIVVCSFVCKNSSLDKHQQQQLGRRRVMRQCTQPWPQFPRRRRSTREAERERERVSGCLRERWFLDCHEHWA